MERNQSTKNKVITQIIKEWIPLEKGWLKINTDASLIEDRFWGLGEITLNEEGHTLSYNNNKI